MMPCEPAAPLSPQMMEQAFGITGLAEATEGLSA